MNHQLKTRQIHLDFHTPELPFELGKNFDKKTFQKTLLDAHINSITLIARCHHGHIYYDTAFPAKHPQMKKDFLMEMVDACHEVGIACPLYLSAGWDAYMAKRHPEYLERKPDGTMYGFENFGQLEPGWKTLCFNSPYVDYLVDITKEMMAHFAGKLDGIFYDITTQNPCDCNYCLEKMEVEGIDPLDETASSRFAKLTNLRFKERMSSEIKKIDPSCPVFFNEGDISPTIKPALSYYSHLEIESLAGGAWGYQYFPVAVRYAKNLGKDYLGMTAKFHGNWGDFGSYKSLAALAYECFLSNAHGAKCSIGDQMYPDGTLGKDSYRLIGEVYGELEKLEPLTTDIKAVTKLALLYPDAFETTTQANDALSGAVNLLNEAHLQFDIIDGDMSFKQYEVLVLPDYVQINDVLTGKLKKFLQDGGKILATYLGGFHKEKQQFLEDFGILDYQQSTYLPLYTKRHLYDATKVGEQVLHGRLFTVTTKDKITEAELYPPLFNRNFHHYYGHYQAPIDLEKPLTNPFYVTTKQTCYLPFNLFEAYKQLGDEDYKKIFLHALFDLLHFKDYLTTSAPAQSDIVLNEQPKENCLLIHYLNYIPVKKANKIETLVEATPVENTLFTLNLPPKYQGKILKKITPLRSTQKIPYTQEKDLISLTLPHLTDYEVLALYF